MTVLHFPPPSDKADPPVIAKRGAQASVPSWCSVLNGAPSLHDVFRPHVFGVIVGLTSEQRPIVEWEQGPTQSRPWTDLLVAP